MLGFERPVREAAVDRDGSEPVRMLGLRTASQGEQLLNLRSYADQPRPAQIALAELGQGAETSSAGFVVSR